MRPVSELPTARALSLRGIVFDMDDTVTRDGLLERAAFNALWDLREAGVLLALVTGRPMGWAEVIARQWPVDLAVAENGAGWAFRRGKALERGYYHDEVERATQARVLAIVRARVARELPHVRVTADHEARRFDLAFDVGEYAQVSVEDRQALVRLIEASGARATTSSVHTHAFAGEWDKARGVVRAAAHALGADLDGGRGEWIFVGDSGNDAAAFAWFPWTVGVANVRDHLDALPVAPRYVTAADRGEGFAELARHVLAHRAP